MLDALMGWVGSKPAARGRSKAQLAALTVSVFGGWLFYLIKRYQGVDLPAIARDTMLEEWAALWGSVLDGET